MRRAYKYRLYPNANQERELRVSLETHRRIYNQALAERKEAYEKEQETLRLAQQYPAFAERRNADIAAQKAGEEGPHWLARISAVSMRDTIKRLDKAFDAFFRRLKAGEKPGYPRFKGRDRYDSIPWDNYGSGAVLSDPSGHAVFGDMADAAELRGCRLRLFGIGSIKAKLHRPIKGKIKTVTVKRAGDKWFVTFSCDLGDVEIEPSTNPAIGIDVGLESFLTTSQGEQVQNPRYLKEELPALRQLNRKIALHDGQKKAKRQYPKRGSKRREKAKRKLRRLHERIANLRKEHHHQTALKLVRRFGFIAVESLNVRGMLRNDRLSRAIGDAGWSGFLLILKSKAESAGVQVVEVDPRGTSQECSGCGQTVFKELSVRRHDCPCCGLSLHRDENAARNILARASLKARIGLAGHKASREAVPALGNPVCSRKSLREAVSKRPRKAAPKVNRSRNRAQNPDS